MRATTEPLAIANAVMVCMYLSLPCVGDCVAPARRGLPLWRFFLLTYFSPLKTPPRAHTIF